MGIFLPLLAFAEPQTGPNINLYATPDQHAKIIRVINHGQPIIPIIEQNNWLKVADPQTGDVGWTPKTILHTSIHQPLMQRYTVTEKGLQGEVQKTYYIESNFPNQDPKQIQAWLEQFRKQEQYMYENFNHLLLEPSKLFFPWQPVIIVKEQVPADKNKAQ